MKKLLLIIVFSIFSIACSQSKSANYGLQVENLKIFVDDIYKNDSAKVKTTINNTKKRKAPFETAEKSIKPKIKKSSHLLVAVFISNH